MKFYNTDVKNITFFSNGNTVAFDKNLPPTPSAYARILMLIIKKSTNPDDITWAENEIIKFVQIAAQNNPEAWGKELIEKE